MDGERKFRTALRGVYLGVAVMLGSMGVSPAMAKDIPSLKTVPVPKPDSLALFVKDERAAIRLGKALFWDMQAGSDGKQACASCHHKAGTDMRSVNTLNPHGASGWTPNLQVVASMFPISSSLVYGSAGVVKNGFVGLSGGAADLAAYVADPVFTIDVMGTPTNVRQVTGRRAPQVINAVYNFRNFWDGRARETFNGVNPFGNTAAAGDARVLQVASNGSVQAVKVSINNASLASQAVGPANSSVEMAWDGRSFSHIGKKLMRPGVTPLGLQTVSGSDSVLGPLAGPKGLTVGYAQMVQDAFQPQWWNSSQCFDVAKAPAACSSSTYSVMESNFSLFWGLAVQLYEATLVSNDSPFDRGFQSAQERRGMDLYTGQARCDHCHGGGETTSASVSAVRDSGGNPTTGFFNTAVRPRAEDGGLNDAGFVGKGFFKTPSLRNLDLRAPYFHNGSVATMRQMVDFYNRGGDFPSVSTDSQVRPLGLTESQKTDLITFLLSLTDNRVRYEKAPFDHPSLALPNGADPLTGLDKMMELPAVGAGGLATPVQPFLGLSPYSP
jgi:cytochrome c peroxidase